MREVLVIIAPAMGLGSSVVFVQNVENANAVVATAQVPQGKYTKTEIKDLLAAVIEAPRKAYLESTIKETSAIAKEDDKLHEAVVTQRGGTETAVIMNKKGEEIK